MDDYIRFLLDESARQGRLPFEKPASVDSQQPDLLAALLAAVPGAGEALSRPPTPPPSIREGGSRIYPTPHEPAFGGCASARLPCETHYIGVPGHFGALPYLRGIRGIAKRMIIAVHGSDLPAWRTHPARRMYDHAARAAESVWGDDYVIIAPVFQKTAFKPYSLAMPWIWYWGGGPRSWGYGNRPAAFDPRDYLIESAGLEHELPRSGYTGRPSSFAILDELVRHELAAAGTSLEYLCLVGHSHGGQAVQRYALLDRGISDHVRQATGRALRYVAMNAGGYAYLTPKRWLASFWGCPEHCEGYDDWPLGLSNPASAEANGVPLEAARQHASSRFGLQNPSSRTALAHNFANLDIHILQSALDTGIGPGASCGPFQQGCSRLDRMRLFAASLFVDLPDALHEQLRVIAGNCRAVDADHPHSGASMFRNATVREVVFGPGY